MLVGDDGIVAGVRFVASANLDERPAGMPIELLVIHNISLPPGQFGGTGIVDLFTNRLDCSAHPDYAALAGLRVSAHFLIRENVDDTSLLRTECSSSPVATARKRA